jgi:hypothetical protein
MALKPFNIQIIFSLGQKRRPRNEFAICIVLRLLILSKADLREEWDMLLKVHPGMCSGLVWLCRGAFYLFTRYFQGLAFRYFSGKNAV